MRYVYPLLALSAFAFFFVATLFGIAFLIAVPCMMLGLALALLGTGHLFAAARALGSVGSIFAGAFRAVAVIIGVVFGALLKSEKRLEGGHSPHELPDLARVTSEVAEKIGTREVDRFIITEEPTMAVVESGGFFLVFGTRRTLIVGLPFLYSLSLDELRGVLAHELGHFARGHNAILGATWRALEAMYGLLEQLNPSVLNPLFWTTRASLFVFERIYHPWQRMQELDVDRGAALAFGANHVCAGLKKARDELPAIYLSIEQVLDYGRSRAIAPSHLIEAAARAAETMNPKAKHAISRMLQGDVLDVRGKTHPPIAARIAALRDLPKQRDRHPMIAASYLGDLRALEKARTRSRFGTRVEYLPPKLFADRFTSDGGQPAPPPPVEPPMFGDELELA